MRQNHCKTHINCGSQFHGKLPSLPFSFPLPLAGCHKGHVADTTSALLRCPRCATPAGLWPASSSQSHTWLIACFQLRAGTGNFTLIKIAIVHPFWKRKCLTACFTQGAEQICSVSAGKAPNRGNECFVDDRSLFLFPRFRSKLPQKCRQNL